MKELKFNQKLKLAYIFIWSIIMVMGVMAYRDNQNAIESQKWVTHTYKVLNQSTEILTKMIDVETGARGFAITHMPKFTEPYYKAIAVIDQDILKLKKLTSDNKAQQKRIQILEELVERKLEISAQMIRLTRANKDQELVQLVSTLVGKNTMDRIRNTIFEIQKNENFLLKIRLKEMNSFNEKNMDFQIILLILIFSIISTGYYFGKKYLNQLLLIDKIKSEASNKLKRIIETVGDGIALSDSQHKYEIYNTEMEKITGYTLEEVNSMDDFMSKIYPNPDDYQKMMEALNQLTEKTFLKDFESTITTKDGTVKTVLISKIMFNNNHHSMILSAYHDISMRKVVELRLKEKNEELKEFAYTVSHDLKAPLRGISGYSQELDRKHKEGLSERALFCINQIKNATANLDLLIEDLLQYARLDQETITITNVDVKAIINAILRDLSSIIDEQKVTVEVEIPFQSMLGWERGFRQIFSNLIDNAIKYSRNAKSPKLIIQATETPNSYLFKVSDNGIGFDMKYADRIFGLFNRLVRSDEFEGTGAGLAIVKKIMDKQNGKITVNSEIGKGTEFMVEFKKSNV